MMKAWKLATVLCLGVVLATADDVLVGSGKNFEDIVKANPFTVVEFYAPWCGHCKNLEPEYAKAATELKAGDPPITLVKVDATEEDNKALASKYGVQGFPTLKMFRDGDTEKPQDYNGPRDAAGIVSYLQKKAGPASKPLTSQAQVEAFKQEEPAILGVFKDEGSAEFTAFSKTADKLSEDFSFAHTFDEDLVEGAGKVPSVTIFKPSEGKTETFDGKFKVKDLEAWLEVKALPLLAELDQQPRNKKALNAAFQSTKPKLFGFVAKDDEDHGQYVAQLTSEAEGKLGEIFFILVDPVSSPQALSYFGLQAEDTPAFVVQDQEAKYLAKNAKPDALSQFLRDFEAGKLEKTIKSEEPPEDNSGPVTVVTGKTFADIVLGGKDVLIEFYAPWCGHCKKLAPGYEKVGEAFANNETVIIAKMDGTANDVPSSKFDVKGFPTIAFVSGDSGDVAVYSGDRTEEDLISFVNKHATLSSSAAAGDHSEL